MSLIAAAPAPLPLHCSHTTTSGDNKREQAEPIPQLPDEGDSTSPIPIVSLDYDTITDSIAARLAISLIGHVLFLKSQVPLPIVQLSKLSNKLSNTKSSPRALKQRNELLSSFDTLTSHLNTTFTALSSAFARINSISKHQSDTNNAKSNYARAYMGVFVGSSPATAKAKVLFAVDGLEIKAIGARDVAQGQKKFDHDDEDCSGSEEDVDGEEAEGEEEGSGDVGDDDDDDSEGDGEEEEEETDEDEDEDDEGSSLPPESRSPSPEPSYPSHAERQRALQAAERLFSRTLAMADANGNGMSADLTPTQTHILLRAPRRFNHPAWIPRQNISVTLESALDEFLEESGIHNEDRQPQTTKRRKASKKGKGVEGVWVVGRAGLNTDLGKDAVRGSDDEWDEMIWWSWDETASSSNLPEPLGKLDDDEVDSSAFKSTSIEDEDEVLQVPKSDESQLIATDESKEVLESGYFELVEVKAEDDLQNIIKLEFMNDESSGLTTALKSEDLSLVPVSRKRRRLLEAVEISTPQWVLPYLDRVKKETQSDREKGFFNPKFKIKRPKEAEKEGVASVFRRVDALSIKPFPLPPHLDRDLLDFTVCREFTSSQYGGNPQQTFPTLSKDNQARHPYRDFMYLNLIYNPYAPQRPGHPGLFYKTTLPELPKELRVLIRIEHGVWLYLGQYELIPAAPLTKEEWAAKSDQTKERWCTKISRKQWDKSMRARIALRRSLGREPTSREVAASDGLGVSADDVRRALDSGIEVMQVWVMKCVGYDEAFQREMKDKRSTWTPPPKAEKVKPRKKKSVKQVMKETVLKTAREDVKTTQRMEASVDKPAKIKATNEVEKAQLDLASNEALWEHTSTMHGVKRKRQDFTSDTIIPINDTDTPEHRPRRVRRMPSRYLLQ
ncbi:hypothetical protein C0995_013978 [Termitomyces sp. Mi166|nr:hypothetical protein C0995_013978 [Termitomyces sp. Mi166\